MFILALSNKIVEKAIQHQHVHLDNFTGSEYLKKIITLPVQIPTWQPKEIEVFIEDLLRRYEDNYFKPIFSDNIKLISSGIRSNPREVKRFMNTFIMTFQILSEDKTVAENATVLLILEALRLRWDWFYEEIFKRKSFLKNVDSLINGKEENPSENKTLQRIIQEKELVDFLTTEGQSLFLISENDMPRFRRAGIIAEETEAEKKLKEEDENDETKHLLANFVKLEPVKQRRAFQLATEDKDFAEKLGYSLGWNFSTLEEEIQTDIWNLAHENTAFGSNLASSMGKQLLNLEPEKQEKAWQTANENPLFAFKFAQSVFPNYFEYPPEIQSRIVSLASVHPDVGNYFGGMIGRAFDKLDDKMLYKIRELIYDHKDFAIGLGFGASQSFSKFGSVTQQEIFDLASLSSDLESELGLGIGKMFYKLDSQTKHDLFSLLEKHPIFTEKLALGVYGNLDKMDQDTVDEIITVIDRNENFYHAFINSIKEFGIRKDQQNKLSYMNRQSKRLESTGII